MPTKVSERKLFASIFLFAIALLVLLNVRLFASPVHVSEMGLLRLVLAFALLLLAAKLLKRAFVKA